MHLPRNPPGHNPRAVFRHRDFRWFMAGRLNAVVGWQIQSLAVAYQIYEMTRNPMSLGFIGLSLFLPILLFSIPAGNTADRYDRRQIVRICQAVLMLCFTAVAGLTLFHVHRVGYFYCILVVISIARAFMGPASQSLLPMIVPKSDFQNAVAWSSSAFQISTIAGPGVGGLMYGLFGPGPTYLIAALMMFLAYVCFTRIRTRTGRMSTETLSWQTVLAGFSYIRNHRVVLGAISLDLFAVLLGGVTALLPIYASDILKVGPGGLGILRSSFAVGALATGLALAHLPPLRRAGPVMLLCTAGFGIFTIVFGLSKIFLISVACMALLGALDMVGVVVRQTLVQTLTPPALLGRVNAVNLVFIGASNELGEFESGLTAAWFGTVPAVILGGLGTILITIIWNRKFPELKRINRLDEALLYETETTATPKQSEPAA